MRAAPRFWIVFVVLCVATTALISRCAIVMRGSPAEPRAGGDPLLPNETVMRPGDTIRAVTSSGEILIASLGGFERAYTWEGGRRSVELWARKRRWLGALGLYHPGPGRTWKSHKGITRPVVSEAQMHFATTEEALAWIAAQQQYAPLVYRNDGLAVSWSKNLSREQLNVDVWQITVGGKAPTELPGSADDAIVLTRGG